MDRLRENLESVRARVATAARRAGRDPAAVRIVAVTKYVDAPQVEAILRAGASEIGENRVQDAERKWAAIDPAATASARLHLVGHLQSNKAKRAAARFDAWHSIDDEGTASAVARHRAALALPPIEGYVELNLAAEPQKSGVAPDALARLLAALRPLARGVYVAGLMGIPPAGEDPRPYFKRLRALALEHDLPGLSMGMSDDLEAAVEEGATLVRVGRALFAGVASG